MVTEERTRSIGNGWKRVKHDATLEKMSGDKLETFNANWEIYGTSPELLGWKAKDSWRVMSRFALMFRSKWHCAE